MLGRGRATAIRNTVVVPPPAVVVQVPDKKFGADTIAAVASAFAALASLAVAAYTLTFLRRQEDIATKQLDATYYAGVYNKQVDALSEFDVSILQLYIAVSPLNATCSSRNAMPFFDWQFQGKITELESLLQVVGSKHAYITLSLPVRFSDASWKLTDLTINLVDAAKALISNKPFDAERCEKFEHLYHQLENWNHTFAYCIEPLLKSGHPLADQDYTQCFSFETKQLK